MGGRQHTNEEALEIIKVFLTEGFPGEERHVRRIGQMEEFEATGRIEGKHLETDD